jgi:hypothetical protein
MSDSLKHFQRTSDVLYDKHQYKFVYSNGQSVIFDSYEEAQLEWMKVPEQFLGHIEVLDRKNSSKGFG